jgi:hypothetical protein
VLEWTSVDNSSTTLKNYLEKTPSIAFAVLTVGHDATPLGAAAQRQYGDNTGLAAARANTIKKELGVQRFPLIVEYRFGHDPDTNVKASDRTPQLRFFEFLQGTP